MNKKDSLGDRMKGNYENRTRSFLPRRTYTIIRLDGKAFHTYTKRLEKPFDNKLSEDLDAAVIEIMPEIQGSQFAYLQSDEISILLTDFAKNTTDAWFDGNVQKICSVSAGLMTAYFNYFRAGTIEHNYLYSGGKECNLAVFDSRVFTIPDPVEVYNYFIWRWKDCERNSISMVAQSLYSDKELHGKNGEQKQEMIFQKGQNWNDLPDYHKNGRFIYKKEVDGGRSEYIVEPCWKLTANPGKLHDMIPKYEYS